MAVYRFSAQVIGRSSGRSATAAAAYRAAARIEDERTGLIHDYARKGGVFAAEILAPENTPDWMRDRAKLWNAVEAAEKRKDAQLCRELLLSLAHELTDPERLELVRSFVRDECVGLGMVADVTVHRPHREGDDRNHHAHVMLTMRSLTGDGFGAKARDWNDPALLERWREQWAVYQNRALERAGRPERVDHRSLEAQGSDREPEPKQGPVATEMERQGKRSKAGDDRRAAKARNQQRDEIKAEAEIIDLELARIERDERRQAAEARGRQAKIEARQQGQARAAIRAAAIRLRELKEQRQETQARHDAAYVGRREERERLRQERDEGRKALFDRYQHAIDQVWKPEARPPQIGPDLSPWQAVNDLLNRQKAVYQTREQSRFGRTLNALHFAPKGQEVGGFLRLLTDTDERRKAFERDQRRTYAQNAPKGVARPPQRPPAPTPATPSPKKAQSDRLRERRKDALAEYDRETRAAAKAMQARHQFQRQAETAEKAALRQAQAEAGERMDQAKAALDEAQPVQQRDATTGRPIARQIDAQRDVGAENLTVEANEAFRGHNPTGDDREAIHGPQDGQSEGMGGPVEGGAGDPAEGKPDEIGTTRPDEGREDTGRAQTPQDPAPEDPRQAEIDALRAWREARDSESREQGSGRERER